MKTKTVRIRTVQLLISVALLALLCGCVSSQGVMTIVHQIGRSPIEPEVVNVPSNGTEIVTLVYKPDGPGPFAVVVFSHGRAGDPALRAKPIVPPKNLVSYWLRKQVALVAPVRIGYGQTGGLDLEDSGGHWKNGFPTTIPNFEKTADNAADSVVSVLNWLNSQNWADPQRIILQGQSVGGLTTVKLGSMNLPGVIAVINFSGGAGGNPKSSPEKSSNPDSLTELYRGYGKQTKVPSIWFYAQNDQYWGPNTPTTWFRAFAEGGSQSKFIHTRAVQGHDGHLLLIFGEDLWREPLDDFVRSLGLN